MTVPPGLTHAHSSGADVTLFDNGEFRLEFEPDGDGGFRVDAPSVARQLGFREAHDLLRAIPAGEKGSALARTPNGGQRTYLTEAGFYRALGQRQTSRIPDEGARGFVERFQSWVFGDVLPKLRRGELVQAPAPAVPALPQTYAEALRELAATVEEREALAVKVAELEPAAHRWDTLVDTAGDYLVGDVAKILQNDYGIKTGPQRLWGELARLGWVYRSTERSRWRAKQTAIDTGRLRERLVTREDFNTGERGGAPPQVRVTHKGINELHKALTVGGQLVALPGGAA